jgi:K+-transporting ATPase ATPase C chain
LSRCRSSPLYPGVVSGIARAPFPAQAGGSLIVKDGKTVGSALIGQTSRRRTF